jgi:uncharacterized repeat protein (TIGR03803 family)
MGITANRAIMVCVFVVGAMSSAASHAGTETVLYSFKGGGDGAAPAAGLILDKAGNLYGTTSWGGGTGCGGNGCGTAFKLATDGTENVLHVFGSGTDGQTPTSGLIRDSLDNLYGTATAGGGNACSCGVVFKITANGKEVILHAFAGGDDGATPRDNLMIDKKGYVFGTATGGGTSGSGVVFRLKGKTEKVLYDFTGGADGDDPSASLIEDKAGNLYSTTTYGGACCGTVFSLSRSGTEAVLYAFEEEEEPQWGVVRDAAGNLFGATPHGGIYSGGEVFELAPDGTLTRLHSFPISNGSDGTTPYAGVVEDAAGNLFGTTGFGGTSKTCTGGCGTLYEIAADGTESVVYSFQGGTDGSVPFGSLIADKNGNYYGTTFSGGSSGLGTVFKIRP